ncbi:SDR family NAD(P)-dependent oxidoreductase [Atrimonas thermophila]|uniref:SDR family NAD(P)-dependent oxidoreductase n=1 Tax=Atrimonas thermophila TaxID=3064161 RepID=UPI00399CA90C
MRLKDKVAIVTGAGQGIGKAIALGLAKEGCSVIVNDINEQTGQQTTQEIQDLGRKAVFVQGDVSKVETAYKLRDTALEEFGRIDILVNNAGIMISGLVVDYSEEDWDRIFAVNAKSVFLMCKVIGKVMIDQRYGKIVNVASIGAKDGDRYQAAYAATKAAVMNFSRAFSKEVAQYGINVNSICPGFVDTEMGKVNLADPEKRKKFIERTPKGRVSVPEDMVGLTVFLCTDESEFIVGQAINVDGGVLYY